MEYYLQYDSPVGMLLLTCRDGALTGLWMDASVPADALPGVNQPVLRSAKRWLEEYFRGNATDIRDLQLAPRGTPFQTAVWQILCNIPCGETRTYGSIAREMAVLLGKEKMSAQAVGQAVGKNPISIIIPCHRVVGTNGKLTGYAGGLEKKAWLLRHEGWR